MSTYQPSVLNGALGFRTFLKAQNSSTKQMNQPKVVWLELMIFYTCSDCNCASRTVAINLEEEDTLQSAHMHNMEEVSALCIVSFCFSDSLFTVQQKYCSTLQCLTLTVARLPGATKNVIRAGKFSRVVARLGNNELRWLLHLNSPPTLVVNMFKIKKYHNTIVAKIAMLEIRSFVDHKLAVFTYFKRNFSLCTS